MDKNIILQRGYSIGQNRLFQAFNQIGDNGLENIFDIKRIIIMQIFIKYYQLMFIQLFASHLSVTLQIFATK